MRIHSVCPPMVISGIKEISTAFVGVLFSMRGPRNPRHVVLKVVLMRFVGFLCFGEFLYGVGWRFKL